MPSLIWSEAKFLNSLIWSEFITEPHVRPVDWHPWWSTTPLQATLTILRGLKLIIWKAFVRNNPASVAKWCKYYRHYGRRSSTLVDVQRFLWSSLVVWHIVPILPCINSSSPTSALIPPKGPLHQPLPSATSMTIWCRWQPIARYDQHFCTFLLFDHIRSYSVGYNCLPQRQNDTVVRVSRKLKYRQNINNDKT